MAPETVVVHSKGMERWLSMELATRLGVVANVRFPFPARAIHGVISEALGEVGLECDPWTPDRLMWAVARVLPDLLNQESFGPLRAYLGAEESDGTLGRRQLQLCRRLADTFDRYITYRPELVLEWKVGADRGEDWQRTLFAAVERLVGKPHLAERVRRFFALLSAGDVQLVQPDRRICFFGVSALPPLFVDVLGGLSRYMEIHLFVLCPSQAYWGHVRSRRDMARLWRRMPREEISDEDLHLEEGNPLLATFGRLGRDFQIVLESRDDDTPYVEPAGELFYPPGEDTMLSVVQTDILRLEHRGTGRGGPEPVALSAVDRSIRFHSCHSPLRQVEVLLDELLRAFDEDPSLEPRHVLVMTPDIEAYAPLIEAVFRGGDAAPAIPYRIVDRSLAQVNPVAEALLKVLGLVSSRVTAQEVLDLLTVTAVQERFEIGPDDLAQIEDWVRTSGIRWAVDGAHRADWEQPDFEENTWRFGLDRLLMGHAFAGDEESLFGNVAPVEGIDGVRAELVGRFVDFAETLFDLLATLQAPATMDTWRERLSGALEELFASTGNANWIIQEVRDGLGEVTEHVATVGFDGRLEPSAVQTLLSGRFDRPDPLTGFLVGGVTFAAMVPMRSIPFQVIGLLGMDDGASTLR